MKNITNRLDKFINEYLPSLTDVMFLKNSKGFELYERYNIEVKDNQYEVKLINGFDTHTFYKIQSALAWCIFDYRNKIIDCNRIVELDRKLHSVDFNIILYQKLIKKTSSKDDKELYVIKMNEDFLHKEHVLKLIKQYIGSAIEWQEKKFNTKMSIFKTKG